MAFDASGVYTRLSNSFSTPVTGTPISPTDADSYFDDIDAALNAYYGTSSTSLSIGTGSKVFTTQANKLFGVGRYVIAVSAADTTNFMYGMVSAYSGTSLTVSVSATGGSGTKTDWIIYIAGGPGATGSTGATGATVGVQFTYSTTTTDSDPGSGIFRFNNATIASVTAAYIDNNEAGGSSISAWLDTFDDSTTTAKGTLVIRGVTTATAWAVFSVTGSVVDGTGYRKLTLTHVASGGVWTNGETFAFQFSRTGDKGADGAGVGDMLAANNLSDLASKKTGYDTISIHGADVASASTIDLDAATGNLVDVTGTTTITAITLADGRERTVRFTGALTLTNGASLVLPGGQNITTAAGDYAIFRGYSAGVVRCVTYVRKDGHGLPAAQATIASGTTTDLGSNTAQNITISGTTTITGFGSSAPIGAIKFLYFSGALTLTHNGTSLIIPGAANITTAAGDCAIVRHESSGNWRVLSFMRAAGRPINSGVSDTFSAKMIHAATTTLQQVIEKVTITAAAPSATHNFDVLTQAVQYMTTACANNWTTNVRGDGSNSLDSIMATGESITIALIVTNTGTAYRHTALTVDGNSVTPQWLGAAAPSAGTINKRDTYTFTIIKTGSATFVAHASFASGN